MAEGAALLVYEVLPKQRLCQRLPSMQYPLRFVFASPPAGTGMLLTHFASNR